MISGAKARRVVSAVIFLVLASLMANPTTASATLARASATPAPTTAMLHSYDSLAQLLATTSSLKSTTGRATAVHVATSRVNGISTSPVVAAETAAAGWKVGDPIENLTKAGNSPSWSAVRARYWKNTANDALEGEYSASNLARMQAGKPPLHDELGVPMELNHIIPRWQGGGHTLDNLEPLWPWEHAAVDPFRFYTGPTP